MNNGVVIVGAGPGGLAAAMLLGNAGVDVTVLEQIAVDRNRFWRSNNRVNLLYATR